MVVDTFDRSTTVKSIAAGFAGAVVILLISYLVIEVERVPSPIPGLKSWQDYVVIAIIVAAIPYTVLDALRSFWIRSIESNLPRLLADVEGMVEGGLSPVMALRHVAGKAYGVLGREIAGIVALLSWGYPYDNVKGIIDARIPHSGASLSLKLLLDAEEGGGDIRSAVRSLRGYVRETMALKKEMYSTTRIQIFVVYLALMVFLYISDVIVSTFLVGVVRAGTAPVGVVPINVDMTRRLFFHMYLAEVVLGGLAIGKLTTGSVGSGVKHVLVLAGIGLLYIMFFAGGM